jgi:hypothetical protein
MLARGGGEEPDTLKRDRIGLNRGEPGTLREDRLGGFSRVSRFGKFRTKGSFRVPLPPFSRHEFGFRRFAPQIRLWRGSTCSRPTKYPKRSNPKSFDPTKCGRTKRTKLKPAPSLKTKRALLHSSKARKTSEPKRAKPNPDLLEPTSPSKPSQRRVVMGTRPEQTHGYPPPERRGHRMSTSDTRPRHTHSPDQANRSEASSHSSYYAVQICLTLVN